MAFSPQKFREIVFQLLYSDDFGGGDGIVEMLMAQLSVTKRVVREAGLVVEKVLEKKAELDEQIAKLSEAYKFERIPGIERNVLRLALFEMQHSDVPPKVAMAEAIRIARKFATPEAATFVNAILDSAYKNASIPALSGQPV